MTGNWWADRLAEADPGKSSLPNVVPPGKPSLSRPHTRRPEPRDNHCPSCGSINYMAAPNSQYYRCYDCGHPISQSGTGVGGTSGSEPVRRAVQVESGRYSPTTIVGRVE